LEKLCYDTADLEDIDDVINNEDFRVIGCAAEEVDDLHHQDEHNRSSELTCQRIVDRSVSHDDADEAEVVQHQWTEDKDFDFLRDLPEVVLQELFDYYQCNGDSNSTSTTNAIATEQEEVRTEPVQDTTTTTITMQPVFFLDNTTVNHKSISLHHTTAVKSSIAPFVSLPKMIALPDDPTYRATYNVLTRTPRNHTHLSPFCQPKKKGKSATFYYNFA
jgi:hypothetical protein